MDSATSTDLSRPAVDVAMDELSVLLADAANASKGEDGLAWLPNWYLGKLNDFEAAREMVKMQTARLIRQIEARQKALAYKWGDSFRQQVMTDLAEQGGKKKSIDYHLGRAGIRTTPARIAVTIADEALAITALEATYPELLKRSINKTALREHIKATGEEIPGVHIEQLEARESFYPDTTTALPRPQGE